MRRARDAPVYIPALCSWEERCRGGLALRELGEGLCRIDGRSWLGEEVPLDAFAAELVENSELVIALHSLGGAGEPERPAEVDKPADHRHAVRVPGDPVDERLVDLHDADGQVSQVAER